MKKITCFKSLFFGMGILVGLIWSGGVVNGQWVKTGLTNKSVYSLSSKGTEIFAGTNSGVFLSTNNGKQWKTMNTGLANFYVTSMAINDTNIFAGTKGGVFLSTNNGSNWTKVNTNLTDTFVNTLATNGAGIYAGTNNGTVFLTYNNGGSWTKVSNGLPTGAYPPNSIQSLYVTGTILFAGTYAAGVYLSTNTGSSWSAVNNGLSLFGTYYTFAKNGTSLFAGGYSGAYISNNYGNSWSNVNTGLSNTNLYALADTGVNIFAGTGDGVFLSSNNGGMWTSESNGFSANTMIRSLLVLGDTIFAGTINYGVWKRPLSEMTGIQELPQPNSFSISPNPLTTTSLLQFPTPIKNAEITIYDILGREVFHVETQNLVSLPIQKGNMQPGVYFVKVSDGERQWVQKLIVQ